MISHTEIKLKGIHADLCQRNPQIKDKLFLRCATPNGEITHIEYEDDNVVLMLFALAITGEIVNCRMDNGSYPGHRKT